MMLPAQLINENREDWLKKGGKENKEAIAFIESIFLSLVKAFMADDLPKTTVDLIKRVITKAGATEQEVKAKLGKPVCPYCKSEMYLVDGEWPRYYWDCGCITKELGDIFKKEHGV